MRTLGMIAAAILACGLAACAVTQFTVDVSSLRDATAAPKTSYALFPGMQATEPTDLQYKEFASYIQTALQGRGFVPAADPSKAELAIFLSYGIGEPQTTYYAYSYPIFGQTGGGTTTFSASTLESGGYSNTTGTVTSQPRWGVVGSGSGVGSVTQFFRWAIVEALDVKTSVETKQLVPVWRTTLTSSGSSGDLRRVFPIMVAASRPYLGMSTAKQVRRVLQEGSPEVIAIKGQKER